jgi:bifunctional N-acetylglucosamine-1-phosphate-uridyltransferase/glucosamine-1-phosphate-acetyltransferase GlmU-like protein
VDSKIKSSYLFLILSAGKGTRMKHDQPKALVPFMGKPLLRHLVDSIKEVGIGKIGIVISPGANKIQKVFKNEARFIIQPEPRGTGDAVIVARSIFSEFDSIAVFVGDSPLIRANTIRNLISIHDNNKHDISFLSSTFPIHFPYARVVRDKNREIIKVVEEVNATYRELLIREYSTSHIVFRSKILISLLDLLHPNPVTEEINLTDAINIGIEKNFKVEAIHIDDYRELVGLNSQEDLKWAEQEFG